MGPTLAVATTTGSLQLYTLPDLTVTYEASELAIAARVLTGETFPGSRPSLVENV